MIKWLINIGIRLNKRETDLDHIFLRLHNYNKNGVENMTMAGDTGEIAHIIFKEIKKLIDENKALKEKLEANKIK